MKKAVCVFLLAFSTSAFANQTPAGQLGELINQRLSYMQAVAADKARIHKPIEDLQQEQQVLTRTAQRAASLGLDPESVKPFIQAQMDAAKAIQYRYRADWLALAHPPKPDMPLAEVREKISTLSDQILMRTAELLQQKAALAQPDFLAQVQQTHLSAADKQRLWQTLTMVRLSHSA